MALGAMFPICFERGAVGSRSAVSLGLELEPAKKVVKGFAVAALKKSI